MSKGPTLETLLRSLFVTFGEMHVPDESEKERIVSALQALPQRFVDERSLWRDIGMALHSSGLAGRARAL